MLGTCAFDQSNIYCLLNREIMWVFQKYFYTNVTHCNKATQRDGITLSSRGNGNRCYARLLYGVVPAMRLLKNKG